MLDKKHGWEIRNKSLLDARSCAAKIVVFGTEDITSYGLPRHLSIILGARITSYTKEISLSKGRLGQCITHSYPKPTPLKKPQMPQNPTLATGRRIITFPSCQHLLSTSNMCSLPRNWARVHCIRRRSNHGLVKH